MQRLGLNFAQIETLLYAENDFRGKVSILDLIENVIDDNEKAKFIANWDVNILVPLLREELFKFKDIDYSKLELEIYELVSNNKLSSTNAKQVFRELVLADELPNVEDYAASKGYLQVSDDNYISNIVDEVLNEPMSQKAVDDFKNGNEKVIGFLVGQVMKKSSGKANPALVQKILRERIKNK